MTWQRKGRAWVRRSRHYVLRVSTGHLPTNCTQWWRVVLRVRRTGAILADSQHCDSRRYAMGLGVRLRRYFYHKARYEQRYGSTVWSPDATKRR